MISSKNIKNIFGNRLNKRHTNKMQSGCNAFRVWNITLIIFIVINIIVVSVSAYLFFQINNGEIFLIENDSNISVETVDRALLNNTIDLFEVRVREFDALKVGRPKVVDPSL